MSRTVYDYDIRAAVCLNCGAPLNVGVHGGQVVCEYCRTPNLVRRRDDSHDRAQATRSAQQVNIPESERLQQLRLQDHRPLAIPPTLQGWLQDGRLRPKHQNDAHRAWLQSLKSVARGAGHLEGEHLFALTILLAPLVDGGKERALLEHAVDVLPDIHHRNVLRCRLAHHAAVDGELEAAEAWLGPVDPRPLSLMADSADRLARCYLALVKGQPQQVFEQLGREVGAFAIFDGYDDEALLLLCHAYEVSGQARESLRRLLARLDDPRHFASFLKTAREDHGIALCPNTLAIAEARRWDDFDAETRPKPPTGAAILVAAFAAVGLALIGAGLQSSVAATSALKEDVFLGVALALVGVLCLSVAVAAIRPIRRLLRLRAGVMTVGQVVSRRQPRSQSQNLDFTSTNFVVAVNHEGKVFEALATDAGRQDYPLGEYPVLFDPVGKQVRLVPLPDGSPRRVAQVPMG